MKSEPRLYKPHTAVQIRAERETELCLEYTKLSVNTYICFSEQKTFFKTLLSIFAWQMNVSHQWSKTQFELAFLGKKGMFSKSSKSSLTVDYITMNIYSSNSCESAPVVLVVVSRWHLIQGLWNNMFFLHYFNLNSILFPFKHFFYNLSLLLHENTVFYKTLELALISLFILKETRR